MGTKYEAWGIPAAEAEADVVRLWRERAAGGPEDAHRPAPSADAPVDDANDAIFRWGYLESPAGSGRCFLLRATDDSESNVVGGVGVGARRVNVSGQSLKAGLLGDFFVTKGHRTFFPALRMQREALEWSKQNVDLLYGFPNASAQPVIKRLGFKELARLHRFVLVLRHAKYLAPKVHSKLAARALGVPLDGFRRLVQPGMSLPAPYGLSLVRFEELDARFDRLFEGRAFRNITVGFRNADLLRWRFLEHPTHPSRVYGLVDDKSGGQLRAYAVIQMIDEVAHIRDLLGIDIASMTQILRLLAGEARRSGASSLSFACAAPGPMKSALERLGFRIRPDAGGPRILFGHVSESITDSRVVSALHHWYATEADEDQ